MKSKWNLFVSLFQLVVGLTAIAAFIVLAINGEDLGRWIITLILAIAFVMLGIIGIFHYKK